MNIPSIYIHEIFRSIQGEGQLTGFDTIFIRLAGCHIACRWCDSKKTWKVNKNKQRYKSLEVLNTITSLANKKVWICFTGGEPLEQLSSMKWLIEKLSKKGFRKLTIETAGLPMPDPKDVVDLVNNNVFFSISPKLISALGKRFNYNNMLLNIAAWDSIIDVPFKLQYKFVVSTIEDLDILKKWDKDFNTEHICYLQIEASKINDKKFIKRCVKFQQNSNFKLCIQTHKILGLR